MKAYWSQDEYTEMFSRGLAFLPADVADIFASLDHWRAQVAVTIGGPIGWTPLTI